jgi:lipopolysaccharide/colanic/teichoic acid biosynthesis glycosyltransferase
MLVNKVNEVCLGEVIGQASPRRKRLFLLSKTCIDLIGACLLLLVFAPVMVAIAVLIKLDSSGPVLFRQRRVGQGGRTFLLYKFRTMYDGADTSVHERHIRSFIKMRGSGVPALKLPNDSRVTKLGRIMRKSSLDELPQLFNVLRGELSLVGPRPPIPYEVQEYEEWQLQRLQVKPGITGLWQVTGRSRVSFSDMVSLDMKYIEEQSLILDLWILLRTIPAVISGKGAG